MSPDPPRGAGKPPLPPVPTLLDRSDEWLVRKDVAKQVDLQFQVTPANVQSVLVKLGFCLAGWILLILSALTLIRSELNLQTGLKCGIVLIAAIVCWTLAAKDRISAEVPPVSPMERV